jgi:hypothetical protein
MDRELQNIPNHFDCLSKSNREVQTNIDSYLRRILMLWLKAKKSFTACGAFIVGAIVSVLMRPRRSWLDKSFSELDVTAAVRKMVGGKAAGDIICSADYYNSLLKDRELLDFFAKR